MRQAMLVVAVMLAAVLVGSSAMAYAKQSEKTAPKKTATEETGPITTEHHAWANYHWARTTNPFTLQLDDNVTPDWDSYLNTTSEDWSKSSVLDTTIAESSNTKKCRATLGRVEVCNAKYGKKGWLGLTAIWAIEDHITRATTKVNDTYFNTATYNTPAWRNLVMCHEVGHTLGLAHQDEDFDNGNLGTCMDYTSDPESNQHPNQHDYDQLETIYSHLDTTTTVGQTSTASEGSSSDNIPGDDPSEWGRKIFTSADGRVSIYEKDLGKEKKVTHVVWTEEQAAKHRGDKEKAKEKSTAESTDSAATPAEGTDSVPTGRIRRR